MVGPSHGLATMDDLVRVVVFHRFRFLRPPIHARDHARPARVCFERFRFFVADIFVCLCIAFVASAGVVRRRVRLSHGSAVRLVSIHRNKRENCIPGWLRVR